MKKSIMILSVVLIVIFCLTACGGADTDPEDSENQDTVTTDSVTYDFEKAVSFFKNGDFVNSTQLFEALASSEYDAECEKYLSAMKYLENVEGVWLNNYLYNDKKDWNYYGSQWSMGDIKVKIGAPYSIVPVSTGDSDWRIETTVNVSASMYVLTGGNGGDTSIKSFYHNGTGSISHYRDDNVNDLNGYFMIFNDEGDCIFTPKMGSNSVISLSFDANEATLMEIPYSYDWNTSYISYAESVTLKHENS